MKVEELGKGAFGDEGGNESRRRGKGNGEMRGNQTEQ